VGGPDLLGMESDPYSVATSDMLFYIHIVATVEPLQHVNQKKFKSVVTPCTLLSFCDVC